MTSLAFILGVLPLVLATGAGSASQRAIGTGVMGGMITATALAVFFVPVFFVVVRRFFKGSERQRKMYAHEIDDAAAARRDRGRPGMKRCRTDAARAVAGARPLAVRRLLDDARPTSGRPRRWPPTFPARSGAAAGARRAPTSQWQSFFADARLRAADRDRAGATTATCASRAQHRAGARAVRIRRADQLPTVGAGASGRAHARRANGEHRAASTRVGLGVTRLRARLLRPHRAA